MSHWNTDNKENMSPSPLCHSAGLRTLSERKTSHQFLPHQLHTGHGAKCGCQDLGLCPWNSNHIQQGGLTHSDFWGQLLTLTPRQSKVSPNHSCQLCLHQKIGWWRHKRHFHGRKRKYSMPCFKAVFLNLKNIKIVFFKVSKARCFRIKQQNKTWHVTMFSNAVLPNQLFSQFFICPISTLILLVSLILASRIFIFQPGTSQKKEFWAINQILLNKYKDLATHEIWSKTEQGVNL